MKSTGEYINIKSIDQLKNEGIISNDNLVNNTYWAVKNPINWMITPSDPFLGQKKQVINEVDETSEDVPYKIESGFWIPAFLVDETVYPEEAPAEEAPVTSESTNHVKYGKVFNKLMSLDPNSTVIYDYNVNKISKLTNSMVDYIVAMLTRLYNREFTDDLPETYDEKKAYIYRYIVTKLL